MTEKQDETRQLGRYYAMAQIGFEMAAPIGLGAYLDYRLGWSPWATVVGAVLGLGGGLYHLVMLTDEKDQPSKRK